MLRCAITDLSAYPLDSPAERWSRLRGLLHRWVVDGIDYIQLREKQMEAGALFALTRAAAAELTAAGVLRRPRLLLNGRADLAAAAGADGVHLPASAAALSAAQVRAVFSAAARPGCLLGISCHTIAEIQRARKAGVDLLLFGPVFEKRVRGELVAEGTGTARLAEACREAAPLPVLALGGVTERSTADCLRAGAAGIASIRLFAGAADMPADTL